jgi:quercetin dioxygenase-like cupin family protein
MHPRGTSFFTGAAAGALVMALALKAGTLFAVGTAQTPKYTIKVVLENDRVRVRDVTFPAGVADTGLHTHDLPHVGVILTAGSLVFSEPGKPSETTKFDAGSVGYRGANVTHQVANPGKTPMRVIEVELK